MITYGYFIFGNHDEIPRDIINRELLFLDWNVDDGTLFTVPNCPFYGCKCASALWGMSWSCRSGTMAVQPGVGIVPTYVPNVYIS